MRSIKAFTTLTLALATVSAYAGSLNHDQLDTKLTRLSTRFPGRVGICVIDAKGTSCINRDQRYSLQSVMKLVVALAVLDKADHHNLSLEDPIIVHREDLSLYVEPIADLVGPGGYRTTIKDLIRRAIVDSDSAAADILIRRIGGIGEVQSFLSSRGFTGIRIDRDERQLQTEIVGLTWKPEYVNPHALDKAIAAVPASQREAAYRRYQTDIRDTSTPAAMGSLLQSLAEGKLLTPPSTQLILQILSETVTFPDRLKAGVPNTWVCMHKTGTSGSWHGITAATNDVAILKSPDGAYISVVAFIADSTATARARAALMRNVSAATVSTFH